MTNNENIMLTIVGGVYLEQCMRPSWHEIYGSGGRAASAIARMGGKVELHTYLEECKCEAINSLAALEGFTLRPTSIPEGCRFYYHHGLDEPRIRQPSTQSSALKVTANNVIRFGLIEGDAIVEADYAVFDPQNVYDPTSFQANGSRANHIALVLNRYEAGIMSGQINSSAEVMAHTLVEQGQAETVVIKMGPLGALVYDKGVVTTVPAYQTSHVWKIGSGDTFVAHFGYWWMHERRSPIDAANMASKATAFYCQNSGFPNQRSLAKFTPEAIYPSQRFVEGYKPKVYLAGPFFTLSQLWLIEQVRKNLLDMGLEVFSPYHNVGHGSADDVVQKDLDGINNSDILFAIGDALDPGTIYEIGYARAKNIPVIMYSENESAEDKKMMEGSGCILCSDYVTAIYKTLWIATSL